MFTTIFKLCILTIMKHELREYQVKAVDEIRESYKNGYNAPLLTMPTGSGKTHVFTYIAEAAAQKGYKTIIVVHRSYLWKQVSDKLIQTGTPHGIIAPGHHIKDEKIQVASVDTLVRRLDKVRRPNLIIFDEAHHVIKNNKWGKVAKYYNSKILGVTATPCRTNGTGLGMSAGNFFDTLIKGPEISELQPKYLSQFKLFAPECKINLKAVKRFAGDYSRKELDLAADDRTIYGDVPKTYRDICYGLPAIAFCVSVKHCEHVAEEFRMNGISAASVSGKTSEIKRQELFTGLANGKYLVLCSCDLVSEGFDVPVCGAAICLRPTQSLALCLQQWGRTTRIANGKDFAYIIDHVGNYLRHGMPDEVREWSLCGAVFDKRTEDENKVLTKACPECFAVHKPAPICPYCGHKYTANELKLPVTDKEAKLIEIEILRKEKTAAITNAKTIDSLHEVAEKLGYKEGWAHYVWKSRKKRFYSASNKRELFSAGKLLGMENNELMEESEQRGFDARAHQYN